MILAPGQPIPHGRPYRYHPNGPVHMMTARKRVRPLPVQQLSVRHFVDHSSSDSLLRHSSSDHSSPNLLSTSAGPSRKRHRVSVTHEEVEELVARRLAEEMKAREVTRNLETLNENEEEQEGENGGNENGGNGGNGNGGNENGGNGGNENEGNG
nr:hypothetical protein [Tanacetum cinerariifolium]